MGKGEFHGGSCGCGHSEKEAQFGANKMKILQPVNVGKMEIKNRLVVPAMGTGFGASDGTVSDRLIEYHEARARGGFGLVIVEVTAIDPLGNGSPSELGIWDDKFMPGLRHLVDRIHAASAKIAVQLHHAGRATYSSNIGGQQPVAPSAIPDPITREMPRELTVEEIRSLVEAYAQGARRAKECGFDAVELHGAHGYLIAQFMSAYANKRTDEYGGNLEGFLRFPLEILQRTRELVGPDYPILFRISADEAVPEGRTIEESVVVAKRLVAAGLDALHVSVGVFESSHLTSAPPAVEPGFNAAAAATIKAAVSVPVIAVGRIVNSTVAEDIISSGKADLVAIGRSSLTDPEFAVKAFEGRDEDIVKCLSCNEGCIDMLMLGGSSITCTQNQALGREAEYASAGAAKAKKVVVAGGGPAGLEAARTAALWGHKVTLCEKRDCLGGQVLLAAVPPAKEVWLEVVRSRIKDLQRLEVEIKLGCELTPELVKELSPDVVIVATGSAPLLPDIPGADGSKAVTAHDALSGAPVGARIVVVGGGMVGCETADYLAQQGKDVTIVEMLRRTAQDVSPSARYFLRRRLKERDVKILTSTSVKAITDVGVVISSEGEERTLEPVDTVVLATGAKSVNDLAAVKELVPEAYVVGDAASPGKILQAVQQAAEVARSL